MLIISNVASGKDFENYIKSKLEKEGFRVKDTPTSHDYGSDLIVDYKKAHISIQCKYYTGQVGIKAVQEVMGSLKYYDADYGVVVTNSTFTQQAKNLARTNGILLISGEDAFPSFRWLFDNSFSGAEKKNSHNQTTSDLMLDDLVVRYGVSKNQIMRYFMSNNLPYEKVGREYHFSLREIEEWEIETRYISCGRSGDINLPAYTQYIDKKRKELAVAQKENNKDEIEKIKADLRLHGVKVYPPALVAFLIVLVIILALVTIFLLAKKMGVIDYLG